jgi:tetraprenyl-beta-curcumene synthase
VPLRADALSSIARKRASTDGAALFSTIPARRCPNLLRLLVAFETMADFLDTTSEHGVDAGGTGGARKGEGKGKENSGARRAGHRSAAGCATGVDTSPATAVQAGTASGVHLHRALSEALDPGGKASDYYRCHPWREDAGYLCALVGACRGCCARLPSYGRVRAPAIRAARLARVLGLNHEPEPSVRDASLAGWARREAEGWEELEWYESTAAASGWLAVLALLALSAASGLDEDRVEETYAAYLPWVSLAGTMLDSYADQAADEAEGEHSYVAHYPCAERAVERLAELVGEAARRARALPDGPRHAVIVACMTAMYLSKDSARAPEMRGATRRLARADGSLAGLLLPVLRAWRIVYSQRDE